MRLGLVHINMGPMNRPDALVQAARAAEQAGFDSVWAGEHLVVPDPQVPPSPMAPQDPVLDSLLALTWAAAHTATIRLATGIVILPQRNPVLLAKQVATLDVLSGGRVMALMGPVEDPATARLARAQLRRTSLGTAISAIQAVCEFTSHSWIGQVDVPAAVVVTARDHLVPVSRQLRLARAIPGASVHEVDADHAVCVTRPQLFTQSLLQACWSVTAARADGTQPGLTGTVL